MSKVFTVNDTDKIPTIDYITDLIARIDSALMSLGSHGISSISTYEEPLKLKNDTPNIAAKDIMTDASHRFISDVFMKAYNEKPTRHELNTALEDIKLQLNINLADTYIKIINTPHVISKLRDIATILNENDLVDGIMEAISSKATEDALEEHRKSATHMTDLDRKALNVIIMSLSKNTTFSDWNADADSVNAIANKPSALPADGGNADTVGDYSPESLVRKDDLFVIADKTKVKDANRCDLLVDRVHDDAVEAEIFKNHKRIYLMEGTYYFSEKVKEVSNVSIYANSKSDVIMSFRNDKVTLNNVDITDIRAISCSTVIIGSNCTLRNCRFKSCTIEIADRATMNRLIDCDFDSCTINVTGNMNNNIISGCRFISTTGIKYIGGNNLMKDNLEC